MNMPTNGWGYLAPVNYGLAQNQIGNSLNTGLVAPTMGTGVDFNPQQSSFGLNPGAAGMGLQYGGQTAGPINLNQGNGFGFNLPTLSAGLQGLSAIGNLYLGSKALGMAKDQFNFSKQMATTNLNNQVKSYNTALEDRLSAREAFRTGNSNSEGWKSDFERLKATT